MRGVVGEVRGAAHGRGEGGRELASALSPLFLELWSEQHVHEKGHADKRFAHAVGLLDLAVHVLAAPDADGQTLIFYEPRDAASRAGLARLLGGPAAAAALASAPAPRARRSA